MGWLLAVLLYLSAGVGTAMLMDWRVQELSLRESIILMILWPLVLLALLAVLTLFAALWIGRR